MIKKTTSLFIVFLGLITLRQAYAVDRLETGFPELPNDARRVAERSVMCIYFAGEQHGDGGERDKEVWKRFKELRCSKVGHDLKVMRAKYKNNTKILSALQEADE